MRPTLRPDVATLVEAQRAVADPLKHQSVERMREQLSALAASYTARPDVYGVADEACEVDDRAIPLRVYRPDSETNGLCLYYHGGGWVRGDLETHDGIARELCVRAQQTIIAVDYRLAPEHPYPAAVQDAYAAVEWAVENADRLGTDRQRIALVGDSSGGNLAAVVANRWALGQGPPLAGQALIYPVLDYGDETASFADFGAGYVLEAGALEAYWDWYAPRPETRWAPELSPARASTVGQAPPTFIGTAECDPLRDQAEEYAVRLAAAGVSTTCVRYQGMFHPFILFTKVLPESRAALADVARWLRGLHIDR